MVTLSEPTPIVAAGYWLPIRPHPNSPDFSMLRLDFNDRDIDATVALDVIIVDQNQKYSCRHNYEESTLPHYVLDVGVGEIHITLKSGKRQTFFSFGGTLVYDAHAHTCTIRSDEPIVHLGEHGTTVVDALTEEAEAPLARPVMAWGLRHRKMAASLYHQYAPQFLLRGTL